MGEGIIVRKGGAATLEINGQETISGKYSETIVKGDTVVIDLIPATFEASTPLEWETTRTLLTDPVNLTVTSNGHCFSSDSVYFVRVHGDAPYITIYKRNADQWLQIEGPDVLPANTGRDCVFSSDDQYLYVGVNDTPTVLIYKRTGDTFTKLANPDVVPSSGNGNTIDIDTSNTYLAVGLSVSPWFNIFKRNGDAFTKLTNPTGFSTPNNINRISFSPNGDYLAAGVSFSNIIFKRNVDTFNFLTSLSDGPTTIGLACRFSNNGVYLAFGDNTNTKQLTIHKRVGDTFTRVFNTNLGSPGYAVNANWSSDDSYLVVNHPGSPFLRLLSRSGDTFTILSNFSPNVPTNGYSDFSGDDIYLANTYGGTSPFINIYKTSTTEIDPAFNLISKANNLLTSETVNTTDFGFALENGIADDVKNVIGIFKKEE